MRHPAGEEVIVKSTSAGFGDDWGIEAILANHHSSKFVDDERIGSRRFRWAMVLRVTSCYLAIGLFLLITSSSQAQVCSCPSTELDCPACDDGIACTVDLCTLAGDCWYLVQTSRCDDGLACTNDICNLETGQCDNIHRGDPACVGNCCQPGEGCIEPTGECIPCAINSDCDDGLPCNGSERCSNGVCLAGTAIDCSLLDSVCTIGVCDDDLAECVAEPANEAGQCDDGDHCTAVDFCKSGVCEGGAHPNACVSLILETIAAGSLLVGDVVAVQLKAYAQGCSALPPGSPCQDGQQELAGVNTIIEWDPNFLRLLGHVDACRLCDGGTNVLQGCLSDADCPGAVCSEPATCIDLSSCPQQTYHWASSGFPSDLSFDGINIPDPTTAFGNDGDAFYAATRQTTCPGSIPACAATVTQGGLTVTTFEFEVLNIPPSQATQISFLPCLGGVSKTRAISNVTLAFSNDVTLPLGLCDLSSNIPFDSCDLDQQCPGGACVITTEVIDFASCDPPAVTPAGSRYLHITPAPGIEAVALLVTGSSQDSEISCVSQYVQADGLLGDTPIFLTPTQWGTVSVFGDAIRPEKTYFIWTDCGNPTTEVLSDPVSANTWTWGDVNSDGVANIADILRVVDGFLGIFVRRSSPCSSNAECTDPILDRPFFECNVAEGFCVNSTLESLDLINANTTLFGCQADGAVDLADILRDVDAFLGLTIPCGPPCP